jgi:hypothetical protein
MCDRSCLDIAEAAFKTIQARCSTIQVCQNTSDPVEATLDIPVQPGLKYAVTLSLQNQDELHFSVENFRLEWMPCTKQSTVDAYIDAVVGFLSGRYRILEHYRGHQCTMAELQVPTQTGAWVTLGVSRHLCLPFLRQSSCKVIRNL